MTNPATDAEIAQIVQDHWCVGIGPDLNMRKLLARIEFDLAEIKRLREELTDLLDSAFRVAAVCDADGWWDSMALSGTCDLGDRLVDLGLWERREGGHGRRWFYRPVKKEPKP